MTIWLQTVETLGEVAWVGRVTDDFEQDLARIKKRHQRSGTDLLYVMAGTIIISNVQISDSQHYMKLTDWRKRFATEYMFAYNRMRRSRAFGRLSLVTPKKGGQSGTSWIVRFYTRAQVKAEAHTEDDNEHGWHVWEDDRGNLLSTLTL